MLILGKNISALITIFGATGDLSYRKLFPSIYNLFQKGYFAESFALIGTGLNELTTEEFRKQVRVSIQNHIDNPKEIESFLNHLFYKQQDVNSKESYTSLLQLSQELDEQFSLEGNRLFYLAISPNFFGIITNHLKKSGLTQTKGFKRIIIEKPFGDDFKSAEKLNQQIRNAFEEDEIFRIDHYLGKEMIQNIERLRFGNTIFEPLWNNKYISNIQITSSEILGVEERGTYYESSGALKDMVQNHLLQIVSLLAMERPTSRRADDIVREKVQVLKALKNVEPIEINQNFVRGQYDKGIINNETVPAYRSETNVNKNSTTETFVAGKIEINNARWSGVPFYIRTGKRMSKKTIQIVIEFKKNPRNIYYENNKANLLVINVQPNEGFSLYVNSKKSNQNNEMQIVDLSYIMPINDKMNTVDAYENLMFDTLLGDQTNFTHWTELVHSWLFIDEIEKVWSYKQPNFPNYKAGENGPKESDELLEKDGLSWWNEL